MPRKYKPSKQTFIGLSRLVFGSDDQLKVDNKMQAILEEVLGVDTEDDFSLNLEKNGGASVYDKKRLLDCLLVGLTKEKKAMLKEALSVDAECGFSLNLDGYDGKSAYDKKRLLDCFLVGLTKETIGNVDDALNHYEKVKKKEKLKPMEKEVEQSILEIMQAINTLGKLMNNGFDTVTTQRIRSALLEGGISYKSHHQKSVEFLKPLEKALSKVSWGLKGVSERGKRNKRCERELVRDLSSIYKQHISDLDNYLEETEADPSCIPPDMENEFIREILCYYKVPISTTNAALNKAKKIYRPHVNKAHYFIKKETIHRFVYLRFS